MVRLIKSVTDEDGFLGKLHTLVLMDDTVILSCSRDVCMMKMRKVLEFCTEFGMEINVKKTSFFVINGESGDHEQMIFENLRIPYKSEYCYLGSYFTDDGKMSSSLQKHITSKTSDINKFTIFCAVNTTIPFYLKKQIFDSCLVTNLLYGCETWLTNDLKEVEKVYIRMIKVLLGVRDSTPTANCLIELGLDNLKVIVEERRHAFLMKKYERIDLDEPIHIMLKICEDRRTKSYMMIKNCLDKKTDIGMQPKEVCLNKDNTRTKFVLYRSVMNNDLSIHNIYKRDRLSTC